MSIEYLFMKYMCKIIPFL